MSYILYALYRYVQCFSMMILLIAYILMNVSPNSKLSNCCTYSFCVHIFLSMHTHTLSIITARGIKTIRAYDSLPFCWVSDQWHLCLPEIIKICAYLGVWFNSFMLCKLDKGVYDFIGSWIALFTVYEGIWKLSIWFGMKI